MEGLDLRGHGSEAKLLRASGCVWFIGGIGEERLSKQGIRHSSTWHTSSALEAGLGLPSLLGLHLECQSQSPYLVSKDE